VCQHCSHASRQPCPVSALALRSCPTGATHGMSTAFRGFLNVHSLGATCNAKNDHETIDIGTSQNHSSVCYKETWRRQQGSYRKPSRNSRRTRKEQSRPSNGGRHRTQQRRTTPCRRANQPEQREATTPHCTSENKQGRQRLLATDAKRKPAPAAQTV
jgi:hypothetical protein